MEKKQRIPLVYGYAICLVTVITFIICVGNMVSSIIDLGDPLHSGYNQQNTPSLASFENYKMDILKAQTGSSTATSTFTPDDATLKLMYEAARADKIANQEHSAKRDIMVNSLLIIISSLLFITHWIWMQKLPKESV